MKKYKGGHPVSCLDELKTYRTVYVKPWERCNPVSFFLAWQWRTIDEWVRKGWILRLEEIK